MTPSGDSRETQVPVDPPERSTALSFIKLSVQALSVYRTGPARHSRGSRRRRAVRWCTPRSASLSRRNQLGVKEAAPTGHGLPARSRLLSARGLRARRTPSAGAAGPFGLPLGQDESASRGGRPDGSGAQVGPASPPSPLQRYAAPPQPGHYAARLPAPAKRPAGRSSLSAAAPSPTSFA